MSGDWTMSMMWVRMPGETWSGATVAFVGMWVVMMVPMMLPSLAPMLWRYRHAVGGIGESRLVPLATLVSFAYFAVWTLVGLAVFPLGVGLTAVEVRLPSVSRAVPLAVGAVVLLAGALQFSPWKARHLACCREAPERGSPLRADVVTAWRLGVHLGVHCVLSCANMTVILLVIGMMDLRAMAAVTAAITAERLAPSGERAARVVGAVVVGSGVLLIARAAGMG